MKRELIAEKNPKSPIAEIFRTLRTNIQFMNSKKSLKTLLVTSTVPSEGKSFVAANLAITFAQAGKKVVLIDADMRKGRVHKMFSVDNIPGLSNYLSGIDDSGSSNENDILKFVKQTEIENLYLITAGNVPPNPSELLASELTENMVEKLKNIFDIVIFDGTPCELVTDSLILARLVDSTIIVSRHKVTKKDSLQRLKKSIENVGGNIAGVVLNRLPVNIAKYKSTYYYSSTPTPEKNKEKAAEKVDPLIGKFNEISQEKSDDIMSQINDFLNSNKE